MIKTYLFTETGIEDDVPLDNWRELTREGCKLLWVDVRSLTPEDMHKLCKAFELHDLAVESALDHFSRPHVYEFPNHLYVNMTVISKQVEGEIIPSELNLFAGAGFVITAVKEEESEAVDKALREFREAPRASAKGPMYAIYLLAEDLVETYYPIVEKLDQEADNIEDEMLGSPDRRSLHRLSDIKRRVFEIRRLFGPQRDIFNELGRRDFPFIEGENQVYFQDAYIRMTRIFDMLDTVREILSGSLDIYLSSVSNRLNEVVKVLTVASIILMTLSFITGFYGMNFTKLPWLQAPNAFRNVIILMVVLIVGMVWLFRRKSWL